MSFSSDVAKFADKVGKSVPDTMRAIALDVFESIIDDTPVDKGTARGNWQTSIGSPKTGVIARTGGSGAIAELKSVLPSFGIDNTIYLTNNLPYINKLEYGGYGRGPGATNKTTRDGYSVNAPYGMVRKNVARIRSIVAKEARKKKV
jgi:hypothetical protein